MVPGVFDVHLSGVNTVDTYSVEISAPTIPGATCLFRLVFLVLPVSFGDMAAKGGPYYSRREWRRHIDAMAKGKGKGGRGGMHSSGWGVSNDFLQTMMTAAASAPVPPPPPPAPWGPRQPRYPPKARPSTAKPDDVKVEESEVSETPNLHDLDPVPIVITMEPAPPPLGSEERPAYVVAVKDWLRHNFTTAEFEFLVA